MNYQSQTPKLDVAPRVGAWIETFPPPSYASKLKSHPAWVRGLKQVTLLLLLHHLRRTPRGCVD